ILFVVLLLFYITSTTFAAVNHKFFHADKQTFDPETGLYTITGNIVINVGSGTIQGDRAQVKLSTLEFFGTGGWFLEQEGVSFRGEKVYVVFNKSVAMIEGGADFQRANLQITSDKVDYNWKSKIAEFKNNVKIVQDGKGVEMPGSVKYNVETGAFVN
ncbi:MAG TPA: LptA/OstA family protein, partial [Negativicutes bacterium]|nr:LptA/OstA family protein [Negativicutes bacterium]